jgi:hypothetical protein
MGLAGVCLFWRPANSPLGTPWKSRTVYVGTKTRLFVTPNWGNDTPQVARRRAITETSSSKFFDIKF